MPDNTTVIYSRVIAIQARSKELDQKKVLRHGLAPVPTSMFHDSLVQQERVKKK